MKPTLTAFVSGTEPEAVHQGTTYEQTVVIRLDNGDELALFDGGVNASTEMIGDQYAIVVTIMPRSDGVEKLSEPATGIEPAEDPVSRWSYVFAGKIVDTEIEDTWFRDPYDRLVELDIGDGLVLVIPTPELGEALSTGEIQTGDYVRIEAARTDVVELDSLASDK